MCKPLLHACMWAQTVPIQQCCARMLKTQLLWAPQPFFPGFVALTFCTPTCPLKSLKDTILWLLTGPQRVYTWYLGRATCKTWTTEGYQGAHRAGDLSPRHLFPCWSGQFGLKSPHPLIFCNCQAEPQLLPFFFFFSFLKLQQLN